MLLSRSPATFPALWGDARVIGVHLADQLDHLVDLDDHDARLGQHFNSAAVRDEQGTRRTTPPRGLGLRLPQLRHPLQRATTLRRRQHLVHPPRRRRRLPELWGARHHRGAPRSRHGMIYRHVSSYTDRHVSSYADTTTASKSPT